jgi:hypothetical protein
MVSLQLLGACTRRAAGSSVGFFVQASHAKNRTEFLESTSSGGARACHGRVSMVPLDPQVIILHLFDLRDQENLLLVNMKEKNFNLLEIQPLPKVLHVQAIRSKLAK